jgi:hypothetical protein
MKYWTIISNILACYAFLQIVVAKYIISRHNKRMKYFPYLINGGSNETWNAEQEAIKYSKSKWAKFVGLLMKIF